MIDSPHLKSIHISNFRSIEDMELHLSSNYIVLTGENNSGKSNILKALSYLYNYSPHELSNNEQHLLYFNPLRAFNIKTIFKDYVNHLLSYPMQHSLNPLKIMSHKCIYIYISPTISLASSAGIEYNSEDPYELKLKSKLQRIISENNLTTKTRFNKEIFRVFCPPVGHPAEQDLYIQAFKVAQLTTHLIPMKSNGIGIQKKNLLKSLLDDIIIESIESKKQYAGEDITVIVGIDEPENSLHPKLQLEIASMLQSEKYNDIIFIVATHSYNFLNFKSPNSNFLVSKEPQQSSQVVVCDIEDSTNFQKITTALGYPIPNEISNIIYGINKDIFIIEGKTDKQHIQNCIELYSKNLGNLGKLENYEIIIAGSASKAKSIAIGCEALKKIYIGFLDNDDEGRQHKYGRLQVLPFHKDLQELIDIPLPIVKDDSKKSIDIEYFLGTDYEFIRSEQAIIDINEEIKKTVDEGDADKREQLEKTLKGIRKRLIKDKLTDLVSTDPNKARDYYIYLKVYLEYLLR